MRIDNHSFSPIVPSQRSGFSSLSGYAQQPSIWQLGTQTVINPYNGFVQMNLPLIETFVRQGQSIIPTLYQLLNQSMQPNQILEGLYLAQRLAEEKTPHVRSLYASAARFNDTTNPLIQVYLAGFYRKLNVPESFGPMLEMLIRNAQQPKSAAIQAGLNPAEEIGGTILHQIQNRSPFI